MKMQSLALLIINIGLSIPTISAMGQDQPDAISPIRAPAPVDPIDASEGAVVLEPARSPTPIMPRSSLDLEGNVQHSRNIAPQVDPPIVPAPNGAVPFIPPRILHYGWPGLRVHRRDVPLPSPKPTETNLETKSLHPRTSRLEIRTRGPARVLIDNEPVELIDGCYLVEHPRPLIPGTTYMHTVRVEEVDARGIEVARTVVVYMRKGRVTELTFE